MPKKAASPSVEPSVWQIPEVAQYFNVPICAVRQLIRRGLLRHQKIGKRFVVSIADAKSFLESRWITEGQAK